MSKKKPETSIEEFYCSFCGKSQHNVTLLIAGPTAFVCDECVGISLDLIIDNVGKDGGSYLKDFLSKTKLDKYTGLPNPNAILREINFPVEYRQACITILANFSNLIRSKYENEDIQVSIKQDGDKLILIIEGPDGIREKVEETMHKYSLVLQGVTEPETLTANPYVLLDLKQQLRIAQLQLENQKDLLTLEQKHSAQLLSTSKDKENMYQDMVLRLSSVLDSNKDDKRLYQLLVESLINVNSSLAKDSVSQLIKVVQEGSQTRSDQDISNALITLRDEEPGVFEKVKKFLEGCGQEMVGNGLYSWLYTLITSLPFKG